MNINFEKSDQVNAVLTVAFVEDDYKNDVKKELSRLGQRPIKGFRPGHVPQAMLQKLFGPQAKAEVVDRLLSRALTEYIIDNKIAVLGEPMLQEGTEVDLKTMNEFEFKFDIGLAPEFELTVDKSLNIPYYNIEVTDEMVQKHCESYRKRFGKQVPGEQADEESMIKGDLVELDEQGNEKPDGIKAERSIVMPRYLADEQKQLFVGAKVGQEVTFNPSEAASGNAREVASMLNIENEEAEQVKSNFKMTITEIMVHQNAELDQEFFDNVLGKDVATNEQEFLGKLREVVAAQMTTDSNYRFTIDAEQALRKMAGDMPMPDEFLKRFLLTRNSENTPEKIEQEYPGARSQLQWQLIKDKAAQMLNVKVTDDDRMRLAKFMAAQQFAQYGMSNLPDNVIENYANKLMEDERYSSEIDARTFDDQFFAALKNAVTLDETTVNVEEFNKLFEQDKQ